MELRKYQREALEGDAKFPGIYRSLEKFQRALIVLPTGTGKTIVFAHACHKWVQDGGRVLILAHRGELLDQAADKLQRAVGIDCALEKAESSAVGAMEAVTVGSVQSLMRIDRLERFSRDHYTHIVVDEAHHCFPLGTKVDGRDIETYRIGDSIRSYDHIQKKVVHSVVIETMNRKVDEICEVALLNGNRLVCTTDHPIWNGSNYVAAATLSRYDMVHEQVHKASSLLCLRNGVSAKVMEFSDDPILLEFLQGSCKGGAQKACECCVRPVWEAIRDIWVQVVPGIEWAHLLFKRMRPRLQSGNKLRDDGADKPTFCVSQDEGEQSNAEGGSKEKNDCGVEGQAVFAQGWKWRNHSPPGDDGDCFGCVWIRSQDGTWCFDKASERFVRCADLADLLQVGHRPPCVKGSNRNRRELSQDSFGERPRYKEDGGLVGIRVESVTVHKRGCGPGFDRLCPDGLVYNLEVSGNNNYFAENILVHNCLGDSYQRIFGYFENSKVLGVTATPDRGDMRDLGTFFETLAYEYTMPRAIAEGFLCKLRCQMIPLDIKLADVGKRDWSEIEVGEALAPYIPQIADALWRTCGGRKLLVFAPLCKIARSIRDALGKVGFRSYYASGEDRSEMTKWNKEGKGACMTNAMLLSEGYDCPDIDADCVLRPTKVRSLYCQMIGRGTRIHPGKDHLLIPDFLWHSERHSLCRPGNLLAETEDVAEKLNDKLVSLSGGESEEVDAEALAEAQQKVLEDREKALAKKLAEQRRKKAKLVDPLQFAASIGSESLIDYQDTFAKEAEKPSLEQLRDIEARGVSTVGMTAGMAAAVLDTMILREKSNMATPKMIRFLEGFGFKHAGKFTRSEAGKLIGRIQGNGFRLPDDMAERVRSGTV